MSTSNKLVSVIIPAYNVEKYISYTIDSVVAQTYTNIEIIVVNDGSTDQTEKIITEHAKRDTRITCISQKNKGLGGARNSGIKAAKGEYICILDADDLMFPNKIERQYEYMESNPDCDITYSDLYYFMDDTFDIYSHLMPTPSGNAVYATLVQYGNFINPNTVFFKKEIFTTCGMFDENLRGSGSEDFDYWLTAAQHNMNFLFQNEYLTLYRIRKNSLTSDGVTMTGTTINVLKKQLDFVKTHDEFKSNIPAINKQLFKYRTLLKFAYLRKGDRVSARKIDYGSSMFNFASYLGSLLPKKVVNSIFLYLRGNKFNRVYKKIECNVAQDFLISIMKKY